MKKNPVLWLVLMIAVVGWNLYSILGPHDEAPSQTLLILEWVLVGCGVAGLIAVAIQLGQERKGRG